MTRDRDEIRWPPRLKKHKLRRLYESDAKGMLDEELLDEVGYTLLARCRAILQVADAQQGRVHCPRCERQGRTTLIERPRHKGDPRDAVLHCPHCDWQLTWGEYNLTYKRKQLNPGGAVESFERYLAEFPAARTPQAKLFAIDRLIHAFHYSMRDQPDVPSRPAGVNLIAGRLSDVVPFLDQLSYGDSPHPELTETRARWRREIRRMPWGDFWQGLIKEEGSS